VNVINFPPYERNPNLFPPSEGDKGGGPLDQNHCN